MKVAPPIASSLPDINDANYDQMALDRSNELMKLAGMTLERVIEIMKAEGWKIVNADRPKATPSNHKLIEPPMSIDQILEQMTKKKGAL
jgi:hypothetical protein